VGELAGWLNEGKPQKHSKFLNQRLRVGEEFIGIFKAANQAQNNFGKTIFYILENESGEVIFDSHNPKIAEFFSYIPFESRISIKKIFKNGKFFYDVKLLNTLQDEEALIRLSKESERTGEGKREGNKRDERLDEKEI
jgi:hypothetical protein